MTRADAAWLVGGTAAGVGFYVADRRGVALCASIRRLFHTDTAAGRAAFRLAFDVGAYVLREHIANG